MTLKNKSCKSTQNKSQPVVTGHLWCSVKEEASVHVNPGLTADTLPEFFHRGRHKNIGVAHQKYDFQFYYAVVKHRLLEKYGEKREEFYA